MNKLKNLTVGLAVTFALAGKANAQQQEAPVKDKMSNNIETVTQATSASLQDNSFFRAGDLGRDVLNTTYTEASLSKDGTLFQGTTADGKKEIRATFEDAKYGKMYVRQLDKQTTICNNGTVISINGSNVEMTTKNGVSGQGYLNLKKGLVMQGDFLLAEGSANPDQILKNAIGGLKTKVSNSNKEMSAIFLASGAYKNTIRLANATAANLKTQGISK